MENGKDIRVIKVLKPVEVDSYLDLELSIFIKIF